MNFLKLFIISLSLFISNRFIYSQANSDSLWIANGQSNNILSLDASDITSTPFIFSQGDYNSGSCIDEDLFWFISTNEETLYAINRFTKQIQHSYSIPTSSSTYYGMASDEDYIWIATADDTLFKITKTTGDIITTSITDGTGHLSIDQTNLYLTNIQDNSFTVINKSNLILNDFSLGAQPDGLDIDENLIYIVCQNTNQIQVFSKDSFNLLNTFSTGNKPSLVTVDEDYLWVSNGNDDTIMKLNKLTGEILNTISVGNKPSVVYTNSTQLFLLRNLDFESPANTILDEYDKSTLTFQKSKTLGILGGVTTDLLGSRYDRFFGPQNIFLNPKKAKGKKASGSSNSVDLAVDDDFSTYYEPKEKAKLIIKLNSKQTISEAYCYVNLLSIDPCMLDWKFQKKKKNGHWKTYAKNTETISQNSKIIISNTLNKKGKTWRLKIHQKSGSCGITELIAK